MWLLVAGCGLSHMIEWPWMPAAKRFRVLPGSWWAIPVVSRLFRAGDSHGMAVRSLTNQCMICGALNSCRQPGISSCQSRHPQLPLKRCACSVEETYGFHLNIVHFSEDQAAPGVGCSRGLSPLKLPDASDKTGISTVASMHRNKSNQQKATTATRQQQGNDQRTSLTNVASIGLTVITATAARCIPDMCRYSQHTVRILTV